MHNLSLLFEKTMYNNNIIFIKIHFHFDLGGKIYEEL